MNEIIKINAEGERQTISARELYDNLGFDKSNWSRWTKQNIEENPFAIEHQDYEGFVIMTNGNQTKDFQLTIDFAKRLCMMAKTEKGEQIRNYFIEIEKQYKQKPMTQMELAQWSINLLVDQERRMNALSETQQQQAEQIKQVQARLETRDENYYSVAGYASIRGLSVDVNRANILGRRAAKLSRESEYDIGKTHDPRFGTVNTYHVDILKNTFEALRTT